MIRHGLVHDSPGYVCPFCPDREHKYPRPDNLQRYVCNLGRGALYVLFWANQSAGTSGSITWTGTRTTVS